MYLLFQPLPLIGPCEDGSRDGEKLLGSLPSCCWSFSSGIWRSCAEQQDLHKFVLLFWVGLDMVGWCHPAWSKTFMPIIANHRQSSGPSMGLMPRYSLSKASCYLACLTVMWSLSTSKTWKMEMCMKTPVSQRQIQPSNASASSACSWHCPADVACVKHHGHTITGQSRLCSNVLLPAEAFQCCTSWLMWGWTSFKNSAVMSVSLLLQSCNMLP